MTPPRVLVIDDDALAVTLITTLLEENGYAVASASDGPNALKLAAEFKPDIVLLDLILPTMSGISVCAELRRMPATRRVPLVVLTARDDPEHITRAFAAGADDYITKPVRKYELVPRMGAHLRSKRVLAELEEQTRDRKLLLELSNTLSSRLEMRQILRIIATRLAEAIRVDRCSIILIDLDGKRGKIVAASEDPNVADVTIALSNYPEIFEVLETRSPLVVSDAEAQPLMEPHPELVPSAAMRASILFPMMVAGDVIGVLLLRSSAPLSELSARELDFGQTVASATAIAVRNAKLFEGITQESVELDTQARVAAEQFEAARRFRDFMDSAADGMVAINGTGRITYLNRVAANLLSLEEGADFFAVAEDGARDKIAMAQRNVDNHIAALPFDVSVTVSGERKLLSVAVSRSLEQEGGTLLVLRDVTQERATDEELSRTKDFLENLINSSADPIIASDVTGMIILFNRAAERILGYAAADVVEKLPVAELYLPGVASEIEHQLRSAGPEGVGRIAAQRRDLVTQSGERVPVSLTLAMMKDEGKRVGTVGIYSDLRERLRMESKLNIAQEKLQLSERQAMLTELAGTAAHELNQPLTSIMGYAELLKKKLADHPEVRGLGVIFSEAERMAEIVRKIGRITKYETKAYVGSTRIVDLDRSIESDENK
jgi:PAS domain S-box-containing protein